MSEFKELLDKMVEILLLRQKIKTKEELLEKLKPYLDHPTDQNNDLAEKLTLHIEEQKQSIQESTNIYEQAMIKREKDAKEFCVGKSSDELKEFLADQYVPYNSWKNADHGELIKLVLEVYDE